MPRNGSGGYSLPSPYPLLQNTTANATDVDTLLVDLGNAMANSVSKDGQTTLTGSLNCGGFRITAVGAPVASTDALTMAGLAAGGTLTLGNQLELGSTSGTIYTPAATFATSNSGTTSNGGTLNIEAAITQFNGNAWSPFRGQLVSFGAGVGTWTVPAGVQMIYVQAAASGGSGGSGTSAVNAGGPGGAGAYCYGWMAVTPGDIFNWGVGAAGAAATGTGSGNAGAATNFLDSFAYGFSLNGGGAGPSYATWSGGGTPYGGTGGSPGAFGPAPGLIVGYGGSGSVALAASGAPLNSFGGGNAIFGTTMPGNYPYLGCGSAGSWSGGTLNPGGAGFINLWY